MMSGRRLSLFVTLASTTAMVIATQLGWVRSGSASRNSYEMFRSAQRLGLDQLTPFRVVWFLLPVLCLGAVLTVGLARHHLGAAFVGAGFLGAASVVSLGVGLTVLVSGLGAGLGAPMGVAAGVGGLVAAGLVLRERRAGAVGSAAS